MRIAILADVHANLTAFEAILRHAEAEERLDAVWHLGDIVGYGPQPNECIALLRSYEHRAVVGNHDLAAFGGMDVDDFNQSAAAAARWTGEQLSDESIAYLKSLPSVVREGDFTLVHGTLVWPEWEYLLSSAQARRHFAAQETRFGLVGHSHIALLCDESGERPLEPRPVADGEVVALGAGRRVLNPGGAGQPRDRDPRAPYALYDSDAGSITLHRVEYDIAVTQQAMEAAGLPRPLSERLAYGQ